MQVSTNPIKDLSDADLMKFITLAEEAIDEEAEQKALEHEDGGS